MNSIFLFHSNHNMGWIGVIISLFITLILRVIARDEENKLINEGKKPDSADL
jgi:hypothetical protein